MKNLFTPPTPPDFSPKPAASPAMSSGGTPDEAKHFDIVDLKQYFHIVVKRIWLVALCFVISLAVVVVMMIRQVPVYRCQATMLISGGLPVPSRLQQQEVKLYGDYLATQERIIRSSLLQKRAKERVGWPADQVANLLRNVHIYRDTQTSFLSIVVESLDPIFGAEYANALAEEYIDFKAEERMDTSQATVISLTQQANRLREELKKSDLRVIEYEKENKVIAIQERGNIAARYLAELSAKAAGYRTERMLLEAQQPLITQASDEIVLTTLAAPASSFMGYSMPSIMALGVEATNTAMFTGGAEGLIERGVVAQPSWKSVRRKKSELESELVDLRTKFRDAHPRVQAVLAQIKEYDRELNVELQYALQQYYSELESLEIKEKSALLVEKEWEDQALDVARKAHEYANLKQNVARLQSLYDLVFNRLKEIDISIGIEPESIRIMERAIPAQGPMAPRRMQSIFVAALIGIGVGIMLVFMLEYIDDSIRYPEEITKGMGLPFFGVIPSASWDTEDLRSHILANIDQKSGMAEAYRNVRSALLFSSVNSKTKSLAITSSVPREGKTTTSMNLAVSLAQAGMRVLLVDADMRRGELHKYFGLEAGRGLSDMLIGQIKPESIIQRTPIANLDMITTGPFPPNPAELVLRPELKSFLAYAERSYDKIIFDCPPLMAVSESGILCSMADAVVFVVWAGQTSRKLAKLSVRILQERGANLIGCVLNNLEFGRVGYYYYSTYYGYYDYDYHYEDKADGKKAEKKSENKQG
ncbi:MAG: polysaccharide biosynthesis tyrosine autokinase [Kiritimatiellae bacterium]|nr:polysaccharide biosynthesis tyrosine autokinase [Kiritimatiellia bacterium]MDD4737179.1 polysaccharide biosynthesis tyrosine autokinase [Kiritimatiellia bacterium]